MCPPLRFDVFLNALVPTLGSEIRKARPCVAVSPDALNRPLRTVLVALMTPSGRAYPYRVPTTFVETTRQISVDQMRVVDRQRLRAALAGSPPRRRTPCWTRCGPSPPAER